MLWHGVLNAVEHQWGTSVSQLRNRLLVNYHVPEKFYRLHINPVMNVVSVYLWLCRENILLEMKHLSYKNRFSWSIQILLTCPCSNISVLLDMDLNFSLSFFRKNSYCVWKWNKINGPFVSSSVVSYRK